MTGLERSYRRLMRAFPRPYRTRREEEMVSVLLQGARPDQGSATPAETVDLLRAGAYARLRLVRADPVALAGVALAASLAVAGSGCVTGLLAQRGQLGVSTQPVVTASLPDRFPRWSPLPAALDSHPAGTAVAALVTGYEDSEVFQQVVGAFRPTLRRSPWGLLSADGQFMTHSAVRAGSWVTGLSAVPRSGSPLLVTDLATGRSTAVPGVRLLPGDAAVAWSADSGLLALRHGGRMLVVDRLTGRTTDVGPGTTAAFSARDDTLAVQVLDHVRVMGAGGRVLTRRNGAGYRIAAAGWSPDGRLLALASPLPGDRSLTSAEPTRSVVLDVRTGTTWDIAKVGEPLAWHGNTSLLVHDGSYQDGGPEPVVAVDVVTGTSRVVMRFAGADYEVRGLQLATGLTPGLSFVAAGRFDRGPQPWGPFLPVAVFVVALALLVSLLAYVLRPARARPRTVSGAVRLVVGRSTVGAVAMAVPLAPLLVYLLAMRPEAVFVLPALVCFTAASAAFAKSLARSHRFAG